MFCLVENKRSLQEFHYQIEYIIEQKLILLVSFMSNKQEIKKVIFTVSDTQSSISHMKTHSVEALKTIDLIMSVNRFIKL